MVARPFSLNPISPLPALGGAAHRSGAPGHVRCCRETLDGVTSPDPRDPYAEKFGAMSAVEKIEWMIETSGWALEPVLPDADADPPRGAYAYTIGIPELTGFPEIAVFGLTPVAARGLLDLVVDLLEGGTEIPIGSEFVGLFDNDLRSIFLPIDVDKWAEYLRTAVAWYKGAPFEMVQLLWPDRIGFLPTEAGYAHHLRLAQPVLGELP